MTKPTFHIDARNMKAVREHIAEAFATQSWWPTQGPLEAQEEFGRAQHNPSTLADWCAKWLDSGQWRQLKRAVDQAGTNEAPRGG